MWCHYFMVWAIRRRRKAMFMCTRMVSWNFAGSRLVTSERTHSSSAAVLLAAAEAAFPVATACRRSHPARRAAPTVAWYTGAVNRPRPTPTPRPWPRARGSAAGRPGASHALRMALLCGFVLFVAVPALGLCAGVFVRH